MSAPAPQRHCWGVVLSFLLVHARKAISLHTNLAGGSGAIARGRADVGRQHMRYTWVFFDSAAAQR